MGPRPGRSHTVPITSTGIVKPGTGSQRSMRDRGERPWPPESHSGESGTCRNRSCLLPESLDGRDALELGCGAGYVSAWLARRGARPVGLDLSTNQLASASLFQREFDLRFPLVQANAEPVPLQSESFDLIVSEYGASIWCDPYRWVPEAARLLRSGGDLIFIVNGTILMLCVPGLESEGPATERLLRPYFGMHRFEWPDDPSIEFHLGYGEWIRLLRANRFDVTDLIEVRPPEDATTRYPFVTLQWPGNGPARKSGRLERSSKRL